MKRFAMKDYGDAEDVLVALEAQPRAIDESHIRVEIKAFAINPYDIALRQGKMQAFRKLNFPYVLGNDAVGIVTEIEGHDSPFAIGEQVLLHAVGGTYGEEIVVPTKKVVKKPESMSWEFAAGVVTPWLTAYNIVTHVLADQIGNTVLIEGASGAVGSLLVQLLKQKGKTVLASASSRNKDFVLHLGADEFAAYDQEDVGKVFADRADIVIDATRGGQENQSGIQAMKIGGIFIALNELPKEPEKAGDYVAYSPSKEYSDQEALIALTKKAAHIQLEIAEVLPFQLSSVIKGHEDLAKHHAAGKIIIKKGDNE
ncbi:NADP-dependent oxidoreductase [Enterococcus hermanniensis]|uniref:Enoyl reductase (ER) domain-containing protein n=1 Tax=Enterococcus hermanniensis TaxID=249189 RepID=A0A1L8TN60_9ENTE|nr:NADP-dependent oxidoreductase [Enterococcus hermanniensis]OJG45673.1 hypothetical protein RV04_GL001962 [Enterococcus hermanniensis]